MLHVNRLKNLAERARCIVCNGAAGVAAGAAADIRARPGAPPSHPPVLLAVPIPCIAEPPPPVTLAAVLQD